ncbi:MAG: complex I NDUFA9 subunit family protein [Gammaproteobacteria bacterium]|nr:complex I NDUFA9 subunit family protein [Gammaproteobacteria bacterium]
MLIRSICILGGTGFVGRSLANRLARDGYALRVLTRDRERNRSALILLPALELIEADVHDPAQLALHFSGCDAVINLVGILNERGRNGAGFRHAHVELAEKVIAACRLSGARRLLHMSALNADAQNGPSHYLRSKGAAEDLAHQAGELRVTSFRPSVIFGAGDSFFNRFAALLRMTPGIFPLACAGARFAPVFIEDVVEAMARALVNPDTYGRRLNLCGPRTYTLEQLVRYTAECIRARRLIIPLPDFLSRLQAAVFDFVPGKPFSTDNYLSATVDSVCERNDLDSLGIAPTPLEAIVPQYLCGRVVKAHYDRFRSRSHRNADGPPV